MRAAVPGLESRHPIGPYLPGLFQEDGMAQRIMSAFDEQLAPVFNALDNSEAYIDAWLAPGDFVEWLASWVGMELDENWPDERRRAVVMRAVELYGRRGTVRGLAEQVALMTGESPEVVENGGVVWSTTTGTPLPGKDDPRFTLRMEVKEGDKVDKKRLERVVAEAKPAHLVASVEVVSK